jgi:hypothetical protein
MSDRRDDFLIEMYRQMLNDINRHILVVWQSVTALIGAFAILSLVEKQIITLDLATSILILLCAWLWAHLIDASYWYNRNLAIIANIERQFLGSTDLRNIHYYFGSHRPDNRMIKHLRIQQMLGLGLGSLVLLYHFSTRVWPGFSLPLCDFSFVRSLPYIVTAGALVYVWSFARNRDTAYAEFLKNSPGIAVDTSGINYGVGHGHDGPSSRES